MTDLRPAKYLDLVQQIRTEVKSGRLKPGDRLPSFVELRNEYGISRGTVEKVHSVLEREGLIVREQGRGVFVASTRQATLTGILGFAGGGFSETGNSLFWAHLLDGIRQRAAQEKRQLLLLTETDDSEIWAKVDGLLLAVNEENIAPLLAKIPTHLPCVSLLTAVDEVSSVMADDYQGAYDATRHLLSLGHRRIGHLVSGFNHLVERRLDGYRDALYAAGIEPSLYGVRQMHPRLGKDSKREFMEQGRLTVQKWLETDWRERGYTALLVQNDNAAVGAIEAFQAAGLCVPQDVSVIGFDGSEMYDFFTPKLTTVQVPVQQMGALAVEMLVRKINALRSGDIASGPEKAMLPTRLLPGNSTASPP